METKGEAQRDRGERNREEHFANCETKLTQSFWGEGLKDRGRGGGDRGILRERQRGKRETDIGTERRTEKGRQT